MSDTIIGRTIFIPGGTSGIGLALALRLQEAGSTVIIGGRRPAVLAELEAAHPGLGTVTIDTTDSASIEAARDELLAAHPELDAVIAMAGIMVPEDVRTPGFLAAAESIVVTNVLGPIRLLAAFTEHLQAQPAAAFVTVSSGLAHIPLSITPTYNATKAAIHQWSESIRLQLADTCVRVIEVVPPAVKTELMPGQSEADYAMPLDDYIDQTLAILRDEPDVTEVLVERARWMRTAESRGEYDVVVEAVNAAH